VSPDGSTATGTTQPVQGPITGEATTLNGVSGTFASGVSADTASPSDNSAWQTSGYPSATASNKTAGVRFDVDTRAYENIQLSWYQRESATASRYFRLQYSTDGVNFVDANVITVALDSTFLAESADLSATPGVKDNPNFAFRIVSEWEYSATGSGASAYVAANATNSYGTGGTARFDLVTVSGTVIPGANTPPTISTITNQTIRVNHASSALAFTVADAQDAGNALTLNKASSNPAVISESGISFGGSGNSRTVTVTAGPQVGASTITLYVIDSGGRSNSTSFDVTVLPENTPPVISALAPTNTLAGMATAAIPFVIGDMETAAGSLGLSGGSSNTTLLPNSGIVFGGSGSNRTVTLTAASGQMGATPLSLTVSDGTNSAETVFALMVTPSPNVIFYDPFNYPDGSLFTNSGALWDNRSGTLGQFQVTNGQALVTGATGEDLIGTLAGAPYARSNHTVLYASLKTKLLGLPKVAPGYFAHFGSSTLHCRVYAGTTNAAPGTFRFFISNATDTNAVAVATDLLTNTTYTVVMRYDIDTATSTLWINPALESDPGITATDVVSAISISAFGLRQDSSVGATILVDDVKVGLTFGAVVGTNNTPSPIPIVYQKIGNNLVLQWTDPSFALQTAPAMGGTFTNLSGATSPYTNPITGLPKFFRLKSN
jgi:hypothetical protein